MGHVEGRSHVWNWSEWCKSWDQGSTVTTCRSMDSAPAYPEPESQNCCHSKVKSVTPSSRVDRLLLRLNSLAGSPKARRREIIGDISVR